MKMKKIFSVLVAAACVFSMAACGGNSGNSNSDANGDASDNSASANTAKVIDVDLTEEEYAFGVDKNQMDLLEENSRNHMEEIRKIKEVQNLTLNKVAIVKYDAFKEMGGKLSFALAMLDKENNGFVMNAIHSSDGCYTYVKEIVKGESYVVLGEEEKEALRQAVNSHNELEQ